MIKNDEMLNRIHGILHGQPWRYMEDLVSMLEYLMEFHRSLTRDNYDQVKVDLFAKKFCDAVNLKMSGNSALHDGLQKYSDLDVAAKQRVATMYFDILKQVFAPKMNHMRIMFEDKDTKVSSRQTDEKITIFNIGTNPKIFSTDDLISLIAHEFTHLLQDEGLSTIPLDIAELTTKYYCSFDSFNKFHFDSRVKELTTQCWLNSILEKEAIAVGKYFKTNINYKSVNTVAGVLEINTGR